MTPLPRLYAIADGAFGNPVEIASALFRGGARLVQLRHKAASPRMLLDETDAILGIAPAGVRVIVNDRADVALVARAAGVHVGQDDIPARAARALAGDAMIVGVSTHNLEQALAADEAPVDYIAVGPVFRTASKINPDPVLGLEGLREICGRVQKPVVAIGGITPASIPDVLASGARSVALIGALLQSADIEARTREALAAAGE